MKDKVLNFIHQQQLIQPGETILVALSGGADSVALLRLLYDSGYKLIALHCNFHLRGKESDRDMEFVQQLCHKLYIELRIQHFDTANFAQSTNQSIEMAARQLRYEWFESVREELHLNSIVVAHHMNDQAETLLLNLIRGTGLNGLKGMQPRNGYIIRPLLCVDRHEILTYLENLQQNYVTDSTNSEREAVRNRIRLDILPKLENINPSIIKTLSDTCANLQGALTYYCKGIRQAMYEGQIDETNFPLSQLKTTADGQTLLHEWLNGKGFSRTQELEVLHSHQAQPGKQWSSHTYRLLRDRNKLVLQPINKHDKGSEIRQETVSAVDDMSPKCAYFDATLITQPLVTRRVQSGDWFIPFGMQGRKLVSDFMTDHKLTLFQKEQQQVVTCGNDIIWLVGLRSDNRYRVTNQTKKILKLSIL